MVLLVCLSLSFPYVYLCVSACVSVRVYRPLYLPVVYRFQVHALLDQLGLGYRLEEVIVRENVKSILNQKTGRNWGWGGWNSSCSFCSFILSSTLWNIIHC